MSDGDVDGGRDDDSTASDHDAALAVHLPVAAQPSLETLVDLGVAAESHGYSRVWLPETWGRDAVTTLSVLAERTDDVGLGTSLVNTYSRSPALVGQTAATLQEASEGRFRLGLGPSGPAVVERWHGEPFERPLRRTREYVDIVRRVLSGESVDYDGECFSLGGFRLRCDPPATPPPVDVGGMGPKAVELAGRFADGWHALMLTPAGLRERHADLERGADLGGRDVDDVHTTLSVPCAVSTDDGGERARALLSRHLAFYVGGMGTFYRDALERQGYDASDAHEAWQAGDRERAVSLLADAAADLGVAGTPAEARDELARFTDLAVVDEVAVSFPRGATGAEIEATMAALAPGE